MMKSWRDVRRFARRTSTANRSKKPETMLQACRSKRAFDSYIVPKTTRLHRQSRYAIRRLGRIGRIALRQPKTHLTFAGEIIRNPAAMGAICPSSRTLARIIAEQLASIATTGWVVELGAGTGNITAALLQQGLAPDRLIAIEQSPKLATHLRKRFPGIQVIEGDASQLGNLLGDKANDIQAIVSGLPLRSLPSTVVKAILAAVQHHLVASGLFVQFTYDLRASSKLPDMQIMHIASRFIWRNLPPARVDVYQMTKNLIP